MVTQEEILGFGIDEMMATKRGMVQENIRGQRDIRPKIGLMDVDGRIIRRGL